MSLDRRTDLTTAIAATMNEQAIRKNESAKNPNGEHKGLAPLGWLIRCLSFAVVILACSAIAFFLYQDMPGLQADTTDIEPVVISEVDSTEVVAQTVDVSAITACINQQIIDEADHPLIPLLEMARYGARIVEENVQDYTATITKRVRWKGKLQAEQTMFCKIRHPVCDSENPIPFSVYTCFMNPKKGQEAIWVQGCHDEKIVAHGPTGFLNLLTLHLEPGGNMAMSGNRYTIESIGMLNLIKTMIEKGTRDLEHGDCRVKITRNVLVGDALCTRLEIIHEEKADHFEFHRAEIYIDDDRNLPIAFRSYIWPDKPGGNPKLLERYYYTDIKLNIGLADDDFNPANEAYHFPGM